MKQTGSPGWYDVYDRFGNAIALWHSNDWFGEHERWTAWAHPEHTDAVDRHDVGRHPTPEAALQALADRHGWDWDPTAIVALAPEPCCGEC